MSRIIFLDLDGVVVPLGAFSEVDIGLVRHSQHAHLDLLVSKTPAEPRARICALATESSATIVLISSWRGVFSAGFIEAFLRAIELGPHLHKDWFAEMRGLPPRPVKGQDIGLWLGDHRQVRQRDCLVIDDEDLGLKERWGFNRLAHVRPNPRIGFQAADVRAAMRLLALEAVQTHG